MAIIIRPFGAANENLVSRNISVPKHMQGQIITKSLTAEERARNRWLIGKLREKHFPHASKKASANKKASA